MNIKLFSVLCFILLLFSCKKTEEQNLDSSTKKSTNLQITESDIENLDYIDFVLDANVERAIERWQEYEQLQEIVTNVKKGDLSFFYENRDAVKAFITDLKKRIPEKLNTLATEARLQVLETKLLKLESLSNLSTTHKEELNIAIKDFLESVSNLNFQMNKKLEKDTQNIQKP